MIEVDKFSARVETLENLMQTRLGGRGKNLSARFRRAGRVLPKRVRRAGRVIADAQQAAAHPKLARLHDPKTIDAAFADVTRYLKTIDPADRRKGVALGIAGGVVFNLMLLAGAIIALLHWQQVI